MQALCRFVTGRIASRLIVALVLALAVVAALFARRVEQDDNVLEFLPKKSPEVATFYEVSDKFGSLDVAIAGIASSDVFSADFLGRLESATTRLNQTDGIDYALSLTSVDDYTPDPQKGGISTDYLVRELPETEEAREALKKRVLANDNVVGNLVSADGKGVVILCFLRHGVDPHTGAANVRHIVTEAFPREQKYWGGSPFISTYIYDITQTDLRRLAPWACLAIVVLMLASFRDVPGMLLALTSTGIGIVITMGTMGLVGMRSNIVLGSIPVILFALGSAPPVHILTRYYVHVREVGTAEAIALAMRDKGAVVVASAVTVIAGLASFVTMDIAPMRVFGVFTALGIALTLVLAVVFVPAAIAVLGLRGRAKVESAILAGGTERIVSFARRHRIVVAAALGLLAVGCALGVRNVDTRMDNATFFDAKSPPAAAEAFLGSHFGGSEYVEVMVEGDMENPFVLRQLQRLADVLAALPDVASVSHLGQALTATNDAMEEVQRLPDTPEKAKLLFGFLTGKKAISQLVTDDRKSAVIHVKLASSEIDRVERALTNIENAVKAETVQAFVIRGAEGPRGAEVKERRDARVLARVVAIATHFDRTAGSKRDAIAALLRVPVAASTDPAERIAPIARFLKSDEFTGDIPQKAPEGATGTFPADPALTIATAVADLPVGSGEDAIRAAIASPLLYPADDPAIQDVAHSLVRPLGEIQKRTQRSIVARRILAEVDVPEEARERANLQIAGALSDLDQTDELLPADTDSPEGTLATRVTGLPVLYRGLSRSVESNQLVSLLSAALLVAVTMTILFRSAFSGALSALPALFTIAVVYGGMGLARIHLDIGTSMLASLIIGAGVDYAIHFLGGWQGTSADEGAAQAARVTGPGIWTNALMVAAGFFVLTLGEARPLKHVGGLTAIAMIAAALATFLLVPIFARKKVYLPRAGAAPAAVPEEKP